MAYQPRQVARVDPPRCPTYAQKFAKYMNNWQPGLSSQESARIEAIQFLDKIKKDSTRWEESIAWLLYQGKAFPFLCGILPREQGFKGYWVIAGMITFIAYEQIFYICRKYETVGTDSITDDDIKAAGDYAAKLQLLKAWINMPAKFHSESHHRLSALEWLAGQFSAKYWKLGNKIKATLAQHTDEGLVLFEKKQQQDAECHYHGVQFLIHTMNFHRSTSYVFRAIEHYKFSNQGFHLMTNSKRDDSVDKNALSVLRDIPKLLKHPDLIDDYPFWVQHLGNHNTHNLVSHYVNMGHSDLVGTLTMSSFDGLLAAAFHVEAYGYPKPSELLQNNGVFMHAAFCALDLANREHDKSVKAIFTERGHEFVRHETFLEWLAIELGNDASHHFSSGARAEGDRINKASVFITGMVKKCSKTRENAAALQKLQRAVQPTITIEPHTFGHSGQTGGPSAPSSPSSRIRSPGATAHMGTSAHHEEPIQAFNDLKIGNVPPARRV